ncbi:MAG: hypothetical protein HeimC2_28680 [Candidatus Heimdallarchaeota archaeon LC_2]|nr:MAG: hypothetical protein HeimC2_28680 [Candidatus Heimdallarchaeota archaeon LC_2]
MSTSETRGYLVGLNSKNQFPIPNKLMQKIAKTTGKTALLIWHPNKKTLKFQSIDSKRVLKITIWFKVITQSLFEDINSLFKTYEDIIIYKTGVLFPYHFSEMPSIEYYFIDEPSHEIRIKELENLLKEFDKIATVESQFLEKYLGDS